MLQMVQSVQIVQCSRYIQHLMLQMVHDVQIEQCSRYSQLYLQVCDIRQMVLKIHQTLYTTTKQCVKNRIVLDITPHSAKLTLYTYTLQMVQNVLQIVLIYS